MLNWLIGIDSDATLEAAQVVLGARWAREGQFWLFLAIVVTLTAPILFYRNYQQRGSRPAKLTLAILRGASLTLLVVTLADPLLQVATTQQVQPTIRFLFDGTQSMLTEDGGVPSQSQQQPGPATRRSRLDVVRSALRGAAEDLASLDYRVEAFAFDGTKTSRTKELQLFYGAQPNDFAALADHLTATGEVSALGAAFNHLADYQRPAKVAALVVLSDFAHNSGPNPLSSVASRKPGTPIHTVGVGADELTDISVRLSTDPKLKLGERANLIVRILPSGVAGGETTLTVTARNIETSETTSTNAPQVVAQRQLRLTDDPMELRIPFTPDRLGLWEFVCSTPVLAGEAIASNNNATRRVTAIDDFLRLLYVAARPNWEWRFVKEALHRDRLVGPDGFRTYLESADARVRRDNPLFLETMPFRRDDFFAYDVLILDDLPQGTLPDEFSEMVLEFVASMGGGLVVLGGPRFGLSGLEESPLAELLPVVPAPRTRLNDKSAFAPRLTSHAGLYAFMNLGDGEKTPAESWTKLQQIPWYQPAARVHEQSLVLSEHPTDTCVDGETQQPLIAIRRYGRGEVVSIAFNELWRLRRGQGEKLHRRFWSQLIYRLGMSHEIGHAKRFVVRSDRDEYQVGDTATITVDAYDADYRPMERENAPATGFTARVLTAHTESGGRPQTLDLRWSRDGQFTGRLPLTVPGRQTVRVDDPVTDTSRTAEFSVSQVTAEQADPRRNSELQRELARRTGGQALEISEFGELVRSLRFERSIERRELTRSLWSTPLWFIIALTLLLAEWLGRRLVHLK